jgi:AcrR family transcriptional regulator
VGVIRQMARADETTRQRRYPPKVRRQLIIDAAIDCIVANGLERTTMRDIARSSGISLGTITYHFDSVEQILGASLELASGRFTDGVVAGSIKHDSALEQLRFLIAACLPDAPESRQMWQLWLELWARAGRDSALAEVHATRHGRLRAVIEALVERGIERGEFEALDPPAFARALLAMLDGAGLQAALGDPDVGLAEARSMLETLLETQLLPNRTAARSSA